MLRVSKNSSQLLTKWINKFTYFQVRGKEEFANELTMNLTAFSLRWFKILNSTCLGNGSNLEANNGFGLALLLLKDLWVHLLSKLLLITSAYF